MSPRRATLPHVQALHAITDYLAHASGSPATVRPRRWALSRAVDQVAKARGTSPEQVRLGELLELAGELTHPSPATARATTSALRALAAHARTAPPAHTHQAPRLRPTPPAHTAADLARLIAYTHGPTPLATRT